MFVDMEVWLAQHGTPCPGPETAVQYHLMCDSYALQAAREEVLAFKQAHQTSAADADEPAEQPAGPSTQLAGRQHREAMQRRVCVRHTQLL